MKIKIETCVLFRYRPFRWTSWPRVCGA